MTAYQVQAFAMIPQQAIMDTTLSHAELRMLAIIATRRNSRHGWTDACHSRLAADHGLAPGSEPRVRQLLIPLIEKGYIERIAGSGRTQSRYRVIYDQPKPSAVGMKAIDDADEEERSARSNFDPPEFAARCAPSENNRATQAMDAPHTIFLEPEERTREERSSLRSLNARAKEKDGSVNSDEGEAVVDLWQAMAKRTGLSAVRGLSAGRAASLRARIKEVGFAGMKEAIEKIEASNHCRGLGDTGWKVDFDFLIAANRLPRILEGRYDNRMPRQNYTNGATELAASIAEMIAAEEADAPMYDLDAQTRLTGPDWRA